MWKDIVPLKTQPSGGKKHELYSTGEGKEETRTTAAAAATVTTTNSGTTTSTTTGVMQNLPVLWLAVGLQSLCHAPLPIVGQYRWHYCTWFMQCSALCLYQVCEAGSNGSWCGRVRESCYALGRSLAVQAGVASHGTKAAGNKKVPACLLSAVALTTPFKGPASNGGGSGERLRRWWEDDNPGPNGCGFDSAFVRWTELWINKSACRNVLLLSLISVCLFSFGLFGMLMWLLG